MNNRKNLSLDEIAAIAKEIDKDLKGAFLRKIQHVENKRFLFFFEKEKAISKLFIRLDMPYLRVHLIEKFPFYPMDEEPIKGLFSPLQGAHLEKVSLYQNDRILELSFDQRLFLYISLIPYKGALSIVSQGKLVFGPPLPQTQTVSFNKEEALELSSKSLEESYFFLEKKEAFQQKRHKLLTHFTHQLKGLEKERERLQSQEKQIFLIDEKTFEADLLSANFSKIRPEMEKIELSDYRKEGKTISLSLEPYKPLHDQLKKRYQEIRKFKVRKEMIPHFLKENANKIDRIKEQISALENAEILEDLLALDEQGFPKKKKQLHKEKEPYRCFTTTSSYKIYVGKSDKENEEISFKFARGNDLWFHVDTFPGAHVLLRIIKGKVVDQESIRDALQLAKHYSKAKEEKVAFVIMSEAKNLHKRKGAPLGQVVLKERHFYEVFKEEERLKRLFSPQPLP